MTGGPESGTVVLVSSGVFYNNVRKTRVRDRRAGIIWGILQFHASYSWSGPQLPKGCGCIGFLSPVHKKIPDSYSEREVGNPGKSGLSSQQ